MTLAELPNSVESRITGLSGDAIVLGRLRELGFISGETVRVNGRAPFGGPILVEIRGAVVALRKTEAECVQL
jgi:Fe2+ transport system protein FeoA